MHKLVVRNKETGTIFFEYGFSNKIGNRIKMYLIDSNNFEILFHFRMNFSPIAFKKCLTNRIVVV